MSADKEAKDAAARYAAVSEELHKDNVGGGSERREYARRNARWATKITTTKKEVAHCRTRDVSEKGASILSAYDFNMRAKILVEITVTYQGMNKVLKAVGEVRHSAIAGDGFAIGVLFIDAPASTTTFLRRYANHRI